MKQFVDANTLQNAYQQTLEVLAVTGVRFESEAVLELFRERGAKVEGDKVFLSQAMVEEALLATPKQDYTSSGSRRVAAATLFSNAPFLLDDATGAIRRCTMEDAINLYKLNETSDIYECVNPGCADPTGNDAPDHFVAQMAMVLKYSDKYPSFGLRATGSNAKGGDVYGSARQAFRLAREFYDSWDEPVLTQGICPNPPLAYDEESLENLRAALDEGQAIALFPCSMGYMTSPESIMGTVIHDFAMCLAGLVYIQLKSPGHAVSLSNFSTIVDIQRLQPNFGSAECIFIQVIFFELCKLLGLPGTICGGFGDGTGVDYQAGMEGMLTTLLPFSLTEVEEVWCYPGLLSAFACGSFHKALLDEEMIRYANRSLQGVDLTIDPKLPEYLLAGQRAGSFLELGSMEVYRRDNYLTRLLKKGGLAEKNKGDQGELFHSVQEALEKRLAAYQLPPRTSAQEKLLAPHLPSICR